MVRRILNKKLIIYSILLIIIFVAIYILVEATPYAAPKPNSLPLGVYGTREDPIYIVKLEGHDVYELFDIDKSTVVNLYCDDPNDFSKIGAVVHYAITTSGELVGWNEERFYYTRTYSDLQTGSGVANYLYYSNNIQAMSLKESSNYITFKKKPT